MLDNLVKEKIKGRLHLFQCGKAQMRLSTPYQLMIKSWLWNIAPNRLKLRRIQISHAYFFPRAHGRTRWSFFLWIFQGQKVVVGPCSMSPPPMSTLNANPARKSISHLEWIYTCQGLRQMFWPSLRFAQILPEIAAKHYNSCCEMNVRPKKFYKSTSDKFFITQNYK